MDEMAGRDRMVVQLLVPRCYRDVSIPCALRVRPPLLHHISIPCDTSSIIPSTLFEKDHMLQSLQKNMEKAQSRMKKYADANRTDRSFAPGDLVYLKMQPYWETSLGLRNALKLTLSGMDHFTSPK